MKMCNLMSYISISNPYLISFKILWEQRDSTVVKNLSLYVADPVQFPGAPPRVSPKAQPVKKTKKQRTNVFLSEELKVLVKEVMIMVLKDTK